MIINCNETEALANSAKQGARKNKDLKIRYRYEASQLIHNFLSEPVNQTKSISKNQKIYCLDGTLKMYLLKSGCERSC